MKTTAAFVQDGVNVPELKWVPIGPNGKVGKGVKGGTDADFPEGWTFSGQNGTLKESVWRAVLARLKAGPPLTITG